MRNIFTILAFALALGVVSCGGSKGMAGDVALRAMEHQVNGEVDQMLALMAGTQEQKDMVKQIYETIDYKETAEKMYGKLQGVELISEEYSDDGQECDVVLRVTYEKKSEEQSVEMVRVGGVWLVDMEMD